MANTKESVVCNIPLGETTASITTFFYLFFYGQGVSILAFEIFPTVFQFFLAHKYSSISLVIIHV